MQEKTFFIVFNVYVRLKYIYFSKKEKKVLVYTLLLSQYTTF